MTIKPLADRVVLKSVAAEETTKSGIILTTAAQEKPQMAEVIAVGPGGIVDGNEFDRSRVVGNLSCVNEKCVNFLPEDKRGYYKKKTAAEGTEGEPAGEPAAAEKKTTKKAATKKTTAKKPAAKKTAKKSKEA